MSYLDHCQQSFEEFQSAALSLNLPEMQRIFAEQATENEEKKDNERIMFAEPDELLRVRFSICEDIKASHIEGDDVSVDSSEDDDSAIHTDPLEFALNQCRFDIVCWPVETGYQLTSDLWLLEEINLSEPQLLQLAEMYVKEWFENERYTDNRSVFMVSSSNSIFYHIMKILYQAPQPQENAAEGRKLLADMFPERNRTFDREAILRQAAEFLMRTYRFDESEILNRIEFLIDLQPKIADFLQEKCTEYLEKTDIQPDAQARCNLIISLLNELSNGISAVK